MWQAYYNCAIAIYDRAKMCGLTKEAEQLWEYVSNVAYNISTGKTLSC